MTKLIIILGVLSLSLSAIFLRLSSAPAAVMALFRMIFATGLLLPFVLGKQRKELARVRRRDVLLSVLSGAIFALHVSLYFAAIKRTSIASSTVLVNTEVFFVALIGMARGTERISVRLWLAMGAAFFGSVLIAMADAGSGGRLVGDLLAVLAALASAINTLIGKRARTRLTASVYSLILYAAATACLLARCLVTRTPLFSWTLRDYLCALGLAVFCTILGHSVFSWGLRFERATFVSMAKLLEPVFATVTAVFLFREYPVPLQLLGGAAVILGILWYIRLEGEEKPEVRPSE